MNWIQSWQFVFLFGLNSFLNLMWKNPCIQSHLCVETSEVTEFLIYLSNGSGQLGLHQIPGMPPGVWWGGGNSRRIHKTYQQNTLDGFRNPQDQPLTCMKLYEKFLVNHGIFYHGDVSKNRGIPKWMVCNGKPYFLMDDLGVPLLLETPIASWFSRRISWSINRWNNSQFKRPTSLRRLDYANVSANVSDVSVRRKRFFWGKEIWRAGKGSENCRFGQVERGKWKERFLVQIFFSNWRDHR